jgi:hypothetical protein
VKVDENWEKSLSFVGLGKNKNTEDPGGQAMANQHTMQEGANQVQRLDKVDNSPRLCTRLFGWFFVMSLDREAVSSSS